ncbi:MAG: hypothetical protein VX764_05890 [Planctomycetota bacterium]|nr:hypothetical protein [Planctomycetota bacterium]
MLKLVWIIFCSIAGGVIGAILLGRFTSVSLSILGGIVGLIVGGLMGKYIEWYHWFD